jgi:hypothetical protein
MRQCDVEREGIDRKNEVEDNPLERHIPGRPVSLARCPVVCPIPLLSGVWLRLIVGSEPAMLARDSFFSEWKTMTDIKYCNGAARKIR